ncbi:MAG TPA: SGNH/GDSL hydrolase family protein [Alphaproteobacteria bacterium]|nr:SGNH/GDSL hydrolase family protein [Alphaproteobacteria bacterium]
MWEFSLRFLGALWNVAAIIAIAVLIVEFGVTACQRLNRRLRYGRAGKPDERANADAYSGADWPEHYFAEVGYALKFDWMPFVHWRQRSFRGVYTNVDERGRRATPGADTREKGALSIHCFGGSTMWGMGARDEGTIPAVLQRRLRAAGHRVILVNQGQSGYIVTQELIMLQQLLKHEGPPDVAVFYDGVNDVFSAEATGRPDAIVAEEARSAEFALLSEERRLDLVRAAFAGVMPRTLRRLREWTGLDLRGPLPRSRHVLLSEEQLAPLARAVIEIYAANVRMIRALARAYGFHALFFWQPVLSSKKLKSENELKWERTAARDIAKRRQLVAASHDAFRRHPDLKGAPDVVDLSSLFDDEAKPVYLDFSHLSETANVTVAEAMLPTVEAAVAAVEARKQVDA